MSNLGKPHPSLEFPPRLGNSDGDRDHSSSTTLNASDLFTTASSVPTYNPNTGASEWHRWDTSGGNLTVTAPTAAQIVQASKDFWEFIQEDVQCLKLSEATGSMLIGQYSGGDAKKTINDWLTSATFPLVFTNSGSNTLIINWGGTPATDGVLTFPISGGSLKIAANRSLHLSLRIHNSESGHEQVHLYSQS